MNTLWSISFITLSPIIYLYKGAYQIISCCGTKKKRLFDYNLEDQLRNNLSIKGGYKAGVGHYANVWTRDSFFALFARNTTESIQVKTDLANRLQNNIKKGIVPFTFHEIMYIPAVLCGLKCKSNKPKPCYTDEKLCQQVMDANSQYIILVHQVWKNIKSKSEAKADKWLSRHEKTLEDALRFYDSNRGSIHVYDDHKHHLVFEKPFANWEDSLLLEGNVPYTNVLWLEASKRFSEMQNYMKEKRYHFSYAYREKLVFSYLDSVKNLDTVTTSLLVLWFIYRDVSKRNFLRLNSKYRNIKWGVPNRERKLGNSMVFLPFFVIGQEKYHNGWYWSWVGLLWCLALHKMRFHQESKRVFEMFDRVVERDGTVYEVYDENSLPITKACYSSEPCFSEGLGMFLACAEILYEN